MYVYMSNTETYINGMKEIISWFVGFQTKATLVIFKYKNFLLVNNMGGRFIWYLLVLYSVCYSSSPVFLMFPFQAFSLRSTSESWILIFTSYSVLRLVFPLGKSVLLMFVKYTGNESLPCKVTVMNFLIKIEQDPVRNK